MLIFIHTCSDTTNILYAKKNLKSLKATVNFELQKLYLWQVLIKKKQIESRQSASPQPKERNIFNKHGRKKKKKTTNQDLSKNTK